MAGERIARLEPLVECFEPLVARFERLVALFGPLVARFGPLVERFGPLVMAAFAHSGGSRSAFHSPRSRSSLSFLAAPHLLVLSRLSLNLLLAVTLLFPPFRL